ncbi:carboxypeptidase M32 [Clostridium cellulovorans]|uniref:Metal-dependent carboxypeptidase n=1 Tax=Clostridium cellulovorans (strain ATCC 35296 / DSM 3052 / OCM 3 / 743B) TaxID=573061 RepID=D9SMR7_CLOC7|nr:carboxypeptidase M32 [Clostridium cellulovorans]ADL49852.1 Carboxypeptidase Taq [Clostridium cellulovorans 743B]
MNKSLNDFKDHLKKIEYLKSTIALLHWDLVVKAPEKSVDYRSDMLGYLSSEEYKLTTGEAMKGFLDVFSTSKDNDDIINAMIRTAKKNYDRVRKIPEDMYKAYTIDASKSTNAWEEAKEKNDFSIFYPHLVKMVEYKRNFSKYFGYKDNIYDALLDEYEPNATVKDIDKYFSELKEGIIDILRRVEKSKVNINDDFLKTFFAKEDQKKFTEFILDKMGYDYVSAGRIDESIHPFTTNFGNKDVRITNHYHENDFVSAVFSAIHEGGHAIYEQNISDDLIGTGLAMGVSMGIHESQSRFYENIIGRSKGFWKFFFPEAKKRFPQFKNVSFDDFYRAINKVQCSLIRIEADELTYSLHIIIRYEIEKMLINGEIEVKDLPSVWNDKYEEYLGVRPDNDAVGVLQDVHWSDGSFGYFPSYALGNIYGAQLLIKIEKEIDDMYAKIEQGELSEIKSWLKENIHKYGAIYEPRILLEKITGERLKPKYFLDYLRKKYEEIYEL